jgi:protein CMS1
MLLLTEAALAIVDTTSWDKPRNLENLPAFIEQFKDERRSNKPGKTLSDAVKQKSTPHTIVIAASGIRAADLTRALRKFQTKESFIAKLFAKHIKLQEAITMVKENKLGMGVGTPQRLIDLFDDGKLAMFMLPICILMISQALSPQADLRESSSTHRTLTQRSAAFLT